jgi:hypothetical protein
MMLELWHRNRACKGDDCTTKPFTGTGAWRHVNRYPGTSTDFPDRSEAVPLESLLIKGGYYEGTDHTVAAVMFCL